MSTNAHVQTPATATTADTKKTANPAVAPDNKQGAKAKSGARKQGTMSSSDVKKHKKMAVAVCKKVVKALSECDKVTRRKLAISEKDYQQRWKRIEAESAAKQGQLKKEHQRSKRAIEAERNAMVRQLCNQASVQFETCAGFIANDSHTTGRFDEHAIQCVDLSRHAPGANKDRDQTEARQRGDHILEAFRSVEDQKPTDGRVGNKAIRAAMKRKKAPVPMDRTVVAAKKRKRAAPTAKSSDVAPVAVLSPTPTSSDASPVHRQMEVDDKVVTPERDVYVVDDVCEPMLLSNGDNQKDIALVIEDDEAEELDGDDSPVADSGDDDDSAIADSGDEDDSAVADSGDEDEELDEDDSAVAGSGDEDEI